jgi:hypothetical protein
MSVYVAILFVKGEGQDFIGTFESMEIAKKHLAVKARIQRHYEGVVEWKTTQAGCEFNLGNGCEIEIIKSDVKK